MGALAGSAGVIAGFRRPSETAAMLRPMHLLVIEDDPKLGRVLLRLLQEDRHLV